MKEDVVWERYAVFRARKDLMVERCQEMMPRRAFNTRVGDEFVYAFSYL